MKGGQKKPPEQMIIERPAENPFKTLEDKTRVIEKAMKKSSKDTANCPECGLPTFHEGGDAKAFCASCNKYFDMKVGKNRQKKAVHSKPWDNTKFKIGIATGAVVVVAIIISLSLFLVLTEERDLISIKDVSKIRGLDVKQNVKPQAMSREDFGVYMEESMDQEWKDTLREWETFYKSMFIIEQDIDLVDIAQNSSAGAVAGFYDPETKQLYVIGEGHTDQYMNRILSHEYTHALQDQHYDLEDFLDEPGFDTRLARTSAVEGDAMLAMEMWTDENIEDTEAALMQIETVIEVVSVLQDILERGGYSNQILSTTGYFPYEGGLSFVEQVYEDGGWEAVNALLSTKPPLSSEHILHFEKYKAYEPVHEITYNCPIDRLQLKFTSNAGELLLNEIINYYSYGYGVTGWGGDKFFHYEDGGDFLSVFRSSWDSEADNSNFNLSYGRVLGDLGSGSGIDDVLSVDGNYVVKTSSGTVTTVYVTNSPAVLEGLGYT